MGSGQSCRRWCWCCPRPHSPANAMPKPPLQARQAGQGGYGKLRWRSALCFSKANEPILLRVTRTWPPWPVCRAASERGTAAPIPRSILRPLDPSTSSGQVRSNGQETADLLFPANALCRFAAMTPPRPNGHLTFQWVGSLTTPDDGATRPVSAHCSKSTPKSVFATYLDL